MINEKTKKWLDWLTENKHSQGTSALKKVSGDSIFWCCLGGATEVSDFEFSEFMDNEAFTVSYDNEDVTVFSSLYITDKIADDIGWPDSWRKYPLLRKSFIDLIIPFQYLSEERRNEIREKCKTDHWAELSKMNDTGFAFEEIKGLCIEALNNKGD